MAYPQGFLFQPPVSLALPFSSGIILGQRTEGSAFAPYSSSATSSPGFSSHSPYGGEPRAAATISSFMNPGYDPSSGVSGSLDYHAFGPLGAYPYGDPTYRKNATRDATATLKAWLNEHRKNPYPTKGEKIMLAIITKMTLTQVSTWFANARRRLKKENKMTWTPRNRSEDEEEEDAIDLERTEEDDEPLKLTEEETELRSDSGVHHPSASDSSRLAFREDPGIDRAPLDQRLPHVAAPPHSGPLEALRASETKRTSSPSSLDSCGATQGPNPAPKPKLWSLAEIATSVDKNTGSSDSPQSRGRSSLSHGPALPRHLYYASPFIPGYSSFRPLGPLQGGSHMKDELLKSMALIQQEKEQLDAEKESLQKEFEQEKETCAQLRREIQEVLHSSQALQEEKEEVKRRLEDATARIVQLEEDLIGVTQKGLQKETELDSLKDRLKKVALEKEALESHVKNERDEKELYKIHLKNRELENTKLSAELQMLKSVDVNKENTIAQFKEEVGRLQACLTEKEKQYKEILAKVSPLGDMKALKEQLRQKEDQLQANQQQSSLLAAELRDASSARDRTMSELYHMKLEADALRQAKAEAQAQCVHLELVVEQMKADAKKEAAKLEEEASTDPAVVAELQREVEDLKLRLLMAAEHYKEKYKECQRLQKQVLKLSEQQGEVRKSTAQEIAAIPASGSPDTSVPGSPGSADPMLEAIIQEKLKGISREASDRNDKYRKCKQMLIEEKERSSLFADELAKTELKLKEQLKTNESLKLQLAAAEDRYKSQVAEKGRELKELRDSFALVVKEKEKLEGELQKSSGKKGDQGASEKTSLENLQTSVPLILQYPVPYAQDTPTALLVSQSPSKLHFGNPYSISDSKDETEEEFSDDQPLKLPPVGPPSWDSNVVCIQPSRNLSRPEGHEEAEENNNVNTNEQPLGTETRSSFVNDGQTPFCFDSSMDMKRCPLCEVIFPPNYDQSKFEEHVESHWKICPMCSEQFPLDCDQKVFENHVLTHFDGHPLNFD